MDLMDIFFTPAPSPMGCAKKTQEVKAAEVPKDLVKISSADMTAVLVKFTSNATLCNIRDIAYNQAFGNNETERINNFSQSAAEFIINVKYAESHQTSPTDDLQIKEMIKGLADNQKAAVIKALAAKISGKLTQEVFSSNVPDVVSERMVNFTYSTNALRDDMRNWCPTSGAPYPRNVSLLNIQGVPMPEPLTLQITNAELKALIAEGKKVPAQACIKGDKESMVAYLKNLDEATRTAIFDELGVGGNDPHYTVCSVSPAAVKSPAAEQELAVTLNGEPLYLLDDENKLPEDQPLTVDFGEGIGAFPATLAKDNKSLETKVKLPADLAAGKRKVIVKLGEDEIGSLDGGFEVKAKKAKAERPAAVSAKPAAKKAGGFCDTNPDDPKCNF